MSTVYVDQVPAIRAKFDKIAARAAKKGFTGGLVLEVGEPYEITEGTPPVTYKSTVVDLSVSGEPPKYDGWSIIGRVDTLPSGSFAVVNAPGIDGPVDSTGYTAGTCDHCNVNRYRKETYVVRHTDGTQKFVGSTCLKDFLGWDTTPYLVFPDQLDLDKVIGGIAFDPTSSLVEAVTWAVLSIEDRGYRRSGELGATKEDVYGLLRGRTARDDERRRELGGLFRGRYDEMQAQAEKVIEFIRSDDFDGDSSYVTTLKAIFGEERVDTGKHLGYVVSAPQAYSRHLGIESERKARAEAEEARRATAEPVPEGKHAVEGTVVNVRVEEDRYSPYGGTVLKMVVLDDRGFKIWSTVPAKIADAMDHYDFDAQRPVYVGHTVEEKLTGLRVRFTATLSASDNDPLFGFAKRPSKAEIL